MNFALRQSLCSEIAGSDRQILLTTHLREQIARIAGIQPGQVELQQPLNYLGFDSLMAVELRNHLITELEVDIPLSVLLEDTSVASLSDRIQDQLAAESPQSPPPQGLPTALPHGNGSRRYPLSQGQWGLWFLYKLAPESAAYHVAFTARIRSAVKVTALKNACQALIDRHPTLRTTYGQEDAEPFQEIQASQVLDFERIDASMWDESTLTRRAIAAYQRPFDLESGPVLRVTLLTQAPQEHVLLLMIHHIAVDGMSFGILLDDLQNLYQAESTNQPISLPTTDYQYTDFVQWQRDLTNDSRGEQLWAYWQQQLAGVSTLILPVDRPRPLIQSYQGASYTFEISDALTTQLRTLAKVEGVTLYVTLLTAFQILLYRYTGQEDIVVGTPASGRSQTEFARTVGFFINMIALRTNLAGNPTFTALLMQVRQTVLAALAHQSYPAPLLIERLGMNRDLSQPGLFRASFNLLNLPKMASDFELSVSSRVGASAQWGDLVLEPFEIPQQEGQNDLVFDVMETTDRLVGIFRYSTDLFESETIRRMADHFHALLQGIVANPRQAIARLPFLTSTEQQLLITWGSPTANYPCDLCIHQLIEAQVERTPTASSIIRDQHSLTYAQLNAQANQLARYLQVRGVALEGRVGVCLERSPILLVAVLAVLKAGGAYVPLDPNYPPDRLSFMLTDAQVTLLLTDAESLETLPPIDMPLICLEHEWDAIAQEDDTNLTNPVQPENLAYIVYTSGSTGKAKGVMIEHRSLVNAYFAWEDAYDLRSLSNHLQMASFSFDVFAGDFIRTLGSGARLVLCPQEWLLEPELLYTLMQEQAIDATEFGPAVLRNLIQYLHQTGKRLDFMRLLVVGSDAFYGQEYQQLQQLCAPETRLINSYGVSEATIDSSYFETTTLELSTEGMVPIGRPFRNTHLVVLDAHHQLVPIGTAGELYIGGVGVARGYVNQPDLTQERFIDLQLPLYSPVGYSRKGFGLDTHEPSTLTPNLQSLTSELDAPTSELDISTSELESPTSDVQSPISELDVPTFDLDFLTSNCELPPRNLKPLSSKRAYKTGDLVRYLKDGNLEYLGRMDQQVKLRGFRIELGEIESILMQHPTVWQGVVTVRDNAGMKSLVAYVVPEPEQNLAIAELRAFLKQKLPEPMLPSAFVVLDSFPLNANGKVDRRALPMPDVFHRDIEIGFVAPRNSIERRIADIWMSILKLDRIGIHDNFFELGGHSLLATQAIAQLRQAFHLELPLRSLFEFPAIAQLAEQIESSFHQRQVLAAPSIVSTAHTGELPLSFAQESLWFLDQLEGIGSTYTMPIPLRFTGILNIAALEQSLNALAQRHAILRTTFPTCDAQSMQAIAPTSSLSLPVVDLQNLSSAEQESRLEHLIAADVQTPFNLAVGSLLRATLLKFSETDHVLLLTLHHIIADGWSIEIFARELGTLYTAFLNHQPSPLPDLPIQYADFALWQRQYLQGEVLESLLGYWQRTLVGAPPVLSLPTDYPRPVVQTFRGKSTSFQLDPHLTESLKSLSQQAKVTLFMTLLSVFQILLRTYSGQDDIVVGTPIANRNRAETAGLIGYFVNILVLRTDLSGNPSFREVLARVYQVAVDAYTYQDLPFEKLVTSLHPERSLSHTPLFQVMFVLQNAPTPELDLPDLTIRGLDIDIITSKFDITLAFRETNHGLQGFVEYNTDLFKSETIACLIGHYQMLLNAIATHPDRCLSELSLLTPTERHQLLIEWNQTEVLYPTDLCIYQRFEAQVERTPDAIAVVLDQQHLTYHQLNTQANQLAHYLQARGVASEGRVGICLERSPSLLVAVLGVLKAGGTYVPLDPNYPSDQLSFMLSDTQAFCLITQQHLMSKLPDHGIFTLCLDQQWQAIAQESQANLINSTAPDQLAYIIYTSGSTGKAKGVMIEHRSLVNAYVAWENAYHLQLLSNHLQMASFSFDVFTGDWVRSLCSGAKLVLCPHEWLLEPELLYGLMRQQAIDTAEFSPAVVRTLMQYLQQTGQRLDFMRLLIVGSDVFYGQEYQQLKQLCAPETRLINSYGVSEATIDSTYFETSSIDLSSEGIVPIGRPFANTQVYLLNPDLQPVPISVAGELYIGGAGLARGYLNRPELTEERFISIESLISDAEVNSDPFPHSTLNTQHSKSIRLYKTGDLARYLSDGTIELLGRCDDQIKLRGFRIETGEIEAVLTQHPAVREVAVVLRIDQTGDKRLVAYVVPQNPFDSAREPLSVSSLRSFLKGELPNYMVPANFVVLDTMPLTSNGKVDRRALPMPAASLELEDSFVAPTAPIEIRLAEIWTEILQRSPIGIHDNFFDLGGHSLLATSLVFRIRNAFAINFPLRYLFEAPTIAALSLLIEQLKGDQASAYSGEVRSIATITTRLKRTPETPVPLSLSQQYIWHMHQADPTGAALNSSIVRRFRGSLSPEVVERSFNEIIHRYEIIRTVFTLIDDQPMQVVLSTLHLSLIHEDLQGIPPEMRESKAVSLGMSVGQRPFDLASAPLLRAALFHLNPEEYWLLITMHHIITDGWSFNLLLQELDTLIQAFSNGKSSPLPTVPFQYADFVLWQQQTYNETAIAQQLTYWHRKLVEDAPIAVDPGDRPSSSKQAGHYFTRFPESLVGAVESLSRSQKVTGFVILLTGLNLALARWSRQQEILVVATVGNRTVPETEGMIGCFINDVILRSHLSPQDTGVRLIQQIQNTVNEAIDHKEVPVQRVIEQTKRCRSLNLMASITMTPAVQPSDRMPRWEAIDLQPQTEQWEDIQSELYTIGATETTPLELYVELSNTIRMIVNYSTKHFTLEDVDRLFSDYQDMLTQLVTNPETLILEFTQGE